MCGMSFLNSVWNVFWRLCICNGNLPNQWLINFLYPMLQYRVLNQKFCRTRWQHKDQLWHWASLWPSFCKNLESASSSLLRHTWPYSAVFYMESSDSFSSPAQSPASDNEIYVEPEAHSFICLSQFLNHSWKFTSSPRLPYLPASAHDGDPAETWINLLVSLHASSIGLLVVK